MNAKPPSPDPSKPPQEPLPDLGRIELRLAHDNTRGLSFVESLPERADALERAAEAEDWSELRRVSEFLVRAGQRYAQPEITACADELCQEMDKPHDDSAIRPKVTKLVRTCRSATSG